MDRNMSPDETSSSDSRTIFWVWTVLTGAALGFGALLATMIVPVAGFGMHPTGKYDASILEFSLIAGLPLGIFQFLALRHWTKKAFLPHCENLFLWFPATTIGVMAILLPLWSFSAMELLIIPPLAAIVMIPGLLILGVGQWWSVRKDRLVSPQWILRTVFGGSLAALTGILIGFVASYVIPIEFVWGSTTGLILGAIQGNELAKRCGQQGRPYGCTIAIVAVFLAALAPFAHLAMQLALGG
jgi:hypothetical protein